MGLEPVNEPGEQTRRERRLQRELSERYGSRPRQGDLTRAQVSIFVPVTFWSVCWGVMQMLFVLIALGIGVFALAAILAP